MRLGTQVRNILRKYKQVLSVAQRAGRAELDEDTQPPNFSEFDVLLDCGKDQTMSADDLLKRIRTDLAEIQASSSMSVSLSPTVWTGCSPAFAPKSQSKASGPT